MNNNIRIIKGGGNLKGKIKVPGDKSISHRALIIGVLLKVKLLLKGFYILKIHFQLLIVLEN